VKGKGPTSCALPDDPAELKALVVEKDRLLADRDQELATHKEQLADREARIENLQQRLRWLERMLFGPKSEKRGGGPAAPPASPAHQAHLLFPELVEMARELEKTKGVKADVTLRRGRTPRKKRGRRKHFPPHLPRVRTTLELPPDQRCCRCGTEMEEMGEEVTRELERLETTLVHEIVRKKYCCRGCQEEVRIAPGPPRVLDRGILGPGFLAHLLVERFLHPMPDHRQEGKVRSEGLELSRAVLCRLALRCAELLQPIVDPRREDVLQAPVIQTDDTPVVVQDSRDGGRKLGRVWIYLDREGRHVYDFTESRKREGPLAGLGGFQGYVQADAYAGYDALFLPGGATEVGCMAHARRKFVEAEATDPPFAREALDRFARLYDVERVAKAQDLDAEGRRLLRQEHAASVLEELWKWMEVTRTQVLDKSPIARAIQYARNQKQALSRYLEDGLLEIDNNAAERGLRQVATGRKNWNHIGNEVGGKAAAVLYSLVMTCKAIDIDPKVYLRDVLLRISTSTDVRELTPHGWKQRWAKEARSIHDELLEVLGTNRKAPENAPA